MDGTQFAIGEQGRLEVGDHCYFTDAVLLVETEVTIGSYVIIGWTRPSEHLDTENSETGAGLAVLRVG